MLCVGWIDDLEARRNYNARRLLRGMWDILLEDATHFDHALRRSITRLCAITATAVHSVWVRTHGHTSLSLDIIPAPGPNGAAAHAHSLIGCGCSALTCANSLCSARLLTRKVRSSGKGLYSRSLGPQIYIRGAVRIRLLWNPPARASCTSIS